MHDITMLWTPATFPVAVIAGSVFGWVLAHFRPIPPLQIVKWMLLAALFWFGPLAVTRLATEGQFANGLSTIGSTIMFVVFAISAGAGSALQRRFHL